MKNLSRSMLLAISAVVVSAFVMPGVLFSQDTPAADTPAADTPAVDAPRADSPTSAADDDAQLSDDEIRKKIRVLLSGYDYFPTRADLDAVTDDVPPVLIELYQAPDAKPSLKGRVIDALGYYDDDVTRQFLDQLLANGDQIKSGHLHKAIVAHTKAFGEKSLDVTARFLEHDDVQLRITASVAIGKHGGKAGRAQLEKRLKVERNAVVREKIEHGLGNTL